MPINKVKSPVFVYNDSHFIFETSIDIHVYWLTKTFERVTDEA